MKTLRLNLGMIALVLGVTGAFAFKPAEHKSTVTGSGDYWFDPTGSTYSGNQNSNADEQTLTGCTGITTPCQAGYRDAQLNVSGNPSSGVKTAQKGSPDDMIYIQE